MKTQVVDHLTGFYCNTIQNYVSIFWIIIKLILVAICLVTWIFSFPSAIFCVYLAEGETYWLIMDSWMLSKKDLIDSFFSFEILITFIMDL